jgi:hypothetical protein
MPSVPTRLDIRAMSRAYVPAHPSAPARSGAKDQTTTKTRMQEAAANSRQPMTTFVGMRRDDKSRLGVDWLTGWMDGKE